MTTESWIVIILTIPLSIIGTLLTPPIVKTYNNLNKNRRYKNIQKSQTEYETVKKYKEDKQEFLLYLLNVVLKTTLMGAIMSLVSGFVFAASQIIPFLSGIAQIINIVGSVFIVNICSSAFKIWNKIKNYDEYTQKLKEDNVIGEKENKFY